MRLGPVFSFFTYDKASNGIEVLFKVSSNMKIRDDMDYQRINLGLLDFSNPGMGCNVVDGYASIDLYLERLRPINIPLLRSLCWRDA